MGIHVLLLQAVTFCEPQVENGEQLSDFRHIFSGLFRLINLKNENKMTYCVYRCILEFHHSAIFGLIFWIFGFEFNKTKKEFVTTYDFGIL